MVGVLRFICRSGLARIVLFSLCENGANGPDIHNDFIHNVSPACGVASVKIFPFFPFILFFFHCRLIVYDPGAWQTEASPIVLSRRGRRSGVRSHFYSFSFPAPLNNGAFAVKSMPAAQAVFNGIINIHNRCGLLRQPTGAGDTQYD